MKNNKIMITDEDIKMLDSIKNDDEYMISVEGYKKGLSSEYETCFDDIRNTLDGRIFKNINSGKREITNTINNHVEKDSIGWNSFAHYIDLITKNNNNICKLSVNRIRTFHIYEPYLIPEGHKGDKRNKIVIENLKLNNFIYLVNSIKEELIELPIGIRIGFDKNNNPHVVVTYNDQTFAISLEKLGKELNLNDPETMKRIIKAISEKIKENIKNGKKPLSNKDIDDIIKKEKKREKEKDKGKGKDEDKEDLSFIRNFGFGIGNKRETYPLHHKDIDFGPIFTPSRPDLDLPPTLTFDDDIDNRDYDDEWEME